jgi:hypothetical protein
VKKRPKYSPTHFVAILIHYLNSGRKWPKNVGHFCNFQKTAQSKQSPNRRKFAQSGHPGFEAIAVVKVDQASCRSFMSPFFDFDAIFTVRHQGCQMVYFQTKNPNLGTFCRVLQLKMLVNFVAIRYILLVYL